MPEPTLTNPTGGAPAAAEPTGAFAGFIADSNTGAFKAGWADSLPEEMKPYAPSVAGVGSFGDLIKEYHTLKSKGDTGVKVPGEGATPAEISAWRKAIGAAEKPEEYGLPKEHESIAKFAAEHGLTKAQAAKLVEVRTQESAAAKAAADKAATDALAGELKQLTDEWGGNAATNAQKAADVAKLFGIDLDRIGNAALVKAFHKLHPFFSESESMRSSLGTPGIASESTNPASVIQAVVSGTHPRSEAWRKGDPETVAWLNSLYRAKYNR
jgi:hypothetical protein